MRKFYSIVLYLCAVSMVLNAAGGQWAFVPSIRGPGWTVLDIVIAIACGLAGYGLWRSANRGAPPLARLRSAPRGAHAAHALVTAGRSASWPWSSSARACPRRSGAPCSRHWEWSPRS